jgi:hypothetical protein
MMECRFQQFRAIEIRHLDEKHSHTENCYYGSPEVRLFAEKFFEKAIAEYQIGNIEAAILLLNRTGAALTFHGIWKTPF